MCVRVCVCARAHVRACVCVCARTYVRVCVHVCVWVDEMSCLCHAALNQRREEGCALIIFHADLTYLPRLLFKACHCRSISPRLTATVWTHTHTHTHEHTQPRVHAYSCTQWTIYNKTNISLSVKWLAACERDCGMWRSRTVFTFSLEMPTCHISAASSRSACSSQRVPETREDSSSLKVTATSCCFTSHTAPSSREVGERRRSSRQDGEQGGGSSVFSHHHQVFTWLKCSRPSGEPHPQNTWWVNEFLLVQPQMNWPLITWNLNPLNLMFRHKQLDVNTLHEGRRVC